MKKSEWELLAKHMWEYAEEHNGKLSILMKELIRKVNTNQGVIIDDME